MQTNSRLRVTVILGAVAMTIGALLAINLEFGSSIATDEIGGNVTKMSPHNESTAMVSPYAGQESRNIKSLSQSDLLSLQNGSGEAFGGLAKAAELNGYPGPRHVLDMDSELELTSGSEDGDTEHFSKHV